MADAWIGRNPWSQRDLAHGARVGWTARKPTKTSGFAENPLSKLRDVNETVTQMVQYVFKQCSDLFAGAENAAIISSIGGSVLNVEGHAMRLTALTIVAALAATGASAQNSDNWTGFYAGFATNIISPEFDNSTASTPLQEGTGFGAYGGYNLGFGDNFVVGAEVGFSGPASFQTSLGSPDFDFERVLNARVRGGYALGNALVYGSLGYQTVEYGAAAGVSTEGSANGLVYGIGLEMLLQENVSVRLDYTSTHMAPDAGTIIGGSSGEQIDANAVGLGVALHF
jgi:outer membrane immunogenic protein